MTQPSNAFTAALQRLRITHARNDLLFTENGNQLIDLLSGGGTTLLGHGNPEIAGVVAEQLGKVWNTSTLPTPARMEATELIEAFFPDSLRLACLYSTGMEAAEFALRVARVATGRRGVIGFERAMHGKSTATAYLGWPQRLVSLPEHHRLPPPSGSSEGEVLDAVGGLLETGSIAAVLFEPLAGSGGGHVATPAFAQALADLCRAHDALLVCDEIFTGLHRTGSAFLHRDLGIRPDIVLMGKAMGNGFPVSAVVVDTKYPIRPEMLPNSTYSGNALASAAIMGTLREMERLTLPAMVEAVEDIITEELDSLRDLGIALRGKGALWILEMPPHASAWSVGVRALEAGVVASVAGEYVRVLPPATITPEHLREGCRAIRSACQAEIEADEGAT